MIRRYLPHWIAAALVLTAIFLLFKKSRSELKSPACAACLLTAFTALVFNPLDAALDGAALFTREVESQRTGRIYFYRLGPDHDDLKYLFNMSREKRSEVRYLSKYDSDPKRLLCRMYPERNIASVLPEIEEDDVIIVLEKHLPDLCAKAAAAGKTTERLSPPKSRLGHRNVAAVRLKRQNASQPSSEKAPAR